MKRIALLILIALCSCGAYAYAQDAGPVTDLGTVDVTADPVPDPSEDLSGWVDAVRDAWSNGLWIPFAGLLVVGLAVAGRVWGPKAWDTPKGTAFLTALSTALVGAGTMMVQKDFSAEVAGAVLMGLVAAVMAFVNPPKKKAAKK